VLPPAVLAAAVLARRVVGSKMGRRW